MENTLLSYREQYFVFLFVDKKKKQQQILWSGISI